MTFSTLPDTSFVNNVDLHQAPSHDGDIPPQGTHAPRPASGEKAGKLPKAGQCGVGPVL